jgi:hypothetical protein
MSEGPSCTPLLVALLPGVRAPVEYRANLVSYFDPVITQIFRERTFIAASGYIGIASLKISCPCGIPL